MLYDIKLRITYDYTNPAVGGRHLVRLLPLDIPGAQSVLSSALDIMPAPDERRDSLDFFGNHMTEFALHAPHAALAFRLTARIDRTGTGALPTGSTPLAELADDLGECRDLGPNSPLHLVSSSVRAPMDAAMTEFARKALRPGFSTLQAVLAVGKALYHHMTFDPDATTVDTPATEAFASRHGVCQDFSHIMIACLRGIGVPAGYVSGFLRTEPPPGKPRLEGADAMHAWVRAWCGVAAGWVEFDPTNDCIAGADHIVVGYGRDYADVAPVKGMMRVSGRQKTHQAVDVIPLGKAHVGAPRSALPTTTV